MSRLPRDADSGRVVLLMVERAPLEPVLAEHAMRYLPVSDLGSLAGWLTFLVGSAVGGGDLSRAIYWIPLHLVAHLTGLALYITYRRGAFDEHPTLAIRARLTYSMIQGLAWGAGGIIWPLDELTIPSIALVCCYAGTTAGATGTLPATNRGFLLFALPALLPTIVYCLPRWWWLSGLWTTFLMTMTSIALRNARILREALELRLENEALLREAREQHDVTERARAEAEAARASAEEAARSKTRFLAAASHDLRQPAQALTLFIDGLKRDHSLSGSARTIAERLEHTSEALRAMLEGLLDISRLDAGLLRPAPRTVRLRRTLDEVAAALEIEADARGAWVSAMGRDVVALVDPVLLARVVHNLGSNALKHGTPEDGGGRVLLAVRRRGARAWVQVWDAGRGIAAEDRERIFGEFVQLTNPERDRRKGLGLGLATVKRICELCDWPLELQSEVGRGAVFSISLPLAEIVSEPLQEPLSLESARACSVLLVEDDILAREAAASWLSARGCRVVTASDVESALLQLEDFEPAVVISDYRLPGALTGVDLVQRLAMRTPPIPAILVTGDSLVITPLDSPADSSPDMLASTAILTKPVPPAALWDAVQSALRNANPAEF